MGIVIVGAGPAGVTVAETLRKLGYDGESTMLSKEPFPPYSPPLMADYLETSGKSKLIFWKGSDFAEKHDIRLKTGVEVVGVSPSSKKIYLSDGGEIGYDRLVIASGSKMWIPLECRCGEPKGRVQYYNFKSLSAVSHLLEEVQKGASKAVVVGAGFIGMEIAITLRKIGLEVLVVEMQDRILPRMVSRETSRYLEGIVRDLGIELLLNSRGVMLKGEEVAEELLLEDGRTIKGDLFIAATGVRPNVEFLADSGIEVGRGISVNEYLETSVQDIYACGDVADVRDLVTGNAYPHAIYPEAIQQGKTVALNIMGYRKPYDGGVNMNSLYHFHLPLISEGAMVGEVEPDETLFYEDGSVMRKIDIKDGKILRFELVGDKKGAGFLHTLLVKREEIEKIKDRILRGKYNHAHLMLETIPH